MGTTGWTKQNERGRPIFLRFAAFVYKLLGRKVVGNLFWPVSLYFYLFSANVRNSSKGYLTKLDFFNSRTTSKIGLIARSIYHVHNFTLSIIDKFGAWQGDLSLDILSFDGKEQLGSKINSGEGVVVISAHLGNIEVMRALANELPGLKVNALMYTKHNPQFNNLLREISPGSFMRVIATEAPSIDLISELQDKIAQGEIVALLADRLMPGSSDKKVAVSFLGETARFPAGPFILASLLAAPVFLVFCLRDKRGGYRVYFEHFSAGIRLPRKDRAQALTQEVTRFAQRLEHYCNKAPYQWFNYYEFWT